MKKTKFMKSLLVAAALCVGASAWADIVETTVVNCDFENGETLFTADSRISVANEINEDLGSHVLKFTTAANSTNGYSLASYYFSSAIGTDAASVKIAFDFYIPKGNAAFRRFFTIGQGVRSGFNKQSYSTAGAMFAFGLARNSSANYFSINGASTTAESSASTLGAWAHAEINVNLSNKTVEYVISSIDGNTIYYTESNVAFTDASASICNQIDFFDCANNFVSYMDNLVITKYVDQSKKATTFTVKYQNANGADLKDAVTYDTYVGDIFTASSADMATFYNADESMKYVYVSGNESKTASETVSDNVITLVFNEYAKVAYTITAKEGDTELGTLASGDAFTDGSTTIYWNKYMKFDGQWYETSGSYGKSITETGNTDVAFNATTISYFVEIENINKSRSAAASVTGTQYSGGQAQRHYKSSQWWTDEFVDGGYFKVYFPYTMANASASTLTIKTRDSAGVFTGTGLELTANSAGAFSGFVTLPAGSSLAICQDTEYNSNILIDYIVLTKIESFSIVGDFSENGWDPTQGIAMTQNTENPAIWTAVVKDFVVTSAKYDYQYKAVANGNWNDYMLGNPNASNNDKNQEYGFNYDGAREGIYTLTFTVNTTANTVGLSVEKQPTATVYFVNNNDWAAENIKIWVWDVNNNNYNYTGGSWPGQTMTATGEQIDGKDVYSWSTYELNPTPTTLIISNNGSDTERTGDQAFVDGATYVPNGAATVTKTISAAGYATYCSAGALDFSNVAGLKAYIAVENGANVSFTQVQNVPANTGVLLKGEAGEYNIPVVASSTTDVASNAFIGVLENTQVEPGAFVLMNGAQGVGFYQTTKTFTVGANTAYLPAQTTGGARTFIGFDSNVSTSINSVAAEQHNGEVYNLQGQRIVAPQKGLYIVNGKKVVLK